MSDLYASSKNRHLIKIYGALNTHFQSPSDGVFQTENATFGSDDGKTHEDSRFL
jgi:hypothetical protein